MKITQEEEVWYPLPECVHNRKIGSTQGGTGSLGRGKFMNNEGELSLPKLDRHFLEMYFLYFFFVFHREVLFTPPSDPIQSNHPIVAPWCRQHDQVWREVHFPHNFWPRWDEVVHKPIDSKAFEPDATDGLAMWNSRLPISVEICRVPNDPEHWEPNKSQPI